MGCGLSAVHSVFSILSEPDATNAAQDAKEAKEESDALKNKESLVKDPRNFTPEEQLARYEESRKNDDWGHQPC